MTEERVTLLEGRTLAIELVFGGVLCRARGRRPGMQSSPIEERCVRPMEERCVKARVPRGNCGTCDSYRTVSNGLLVRATENKRSDSRVITTGLRLSTVTPMALYVLLTGKTSLQLIDEYKSGITQKEKKNFIKMALNPLSPYYRCFEKNARESILKQVLGGSSIGSSKVDEAVSLNEISCILNEGSQLVDCIFESNFSILAELVNKLEGSRIATALGFRRIIMNSNALIRIDLNDKSHTIR